MISQELLKPDFGWFHFFRDLIRSGKWAGMSLAAKALYPVIKSYCNSDNGAAFPSYSTLEEKSGLSRKTVTVALKELAKLELITESKTQSKVTIYSLKENFDIRHPHNGRDVTGSFSYVSKNVDDSVRELKEFLKSGIAGKNITINILTGEYATSTTNNVIIDKTDNNYGDELDKILKMLEKEPVDNS